jgi:DNA-binding MarR family transcriptional regulator
VPDGPSGFYNGSAAIRARPRDPRNGGLTFTPRTQYLLPPGVEGNRSVSEPAREADDPEIVLGVLSSIERNSTITQRKLAGQLGIALGLTNAYLRRCVRKGFVKVAQVPLNRYTYYLTPQGFAEKSRLTAEYLAVSFNFFRRARSNCAALVAECAARGRRRVALYGAGELAEIAMLSAGGTAVEVICVIDDSAAGRRLAGLPVVADVAAAQQMAGRAGLDGIIFTDTTAPQSRFDALVADAAALGFAVDDILVPDLLGVSIRPPQDHAVAAAEGVEA